MTELSESIKLTGSVRRQLFAEDGTLLLDLTDHNLVVTVGKQYLASWLAASSQSGEFMSYIGVGTGMTAPTSGDTNLQTPLPTRVQGTLTSSSNTWQNVATFGPGVDTGAITEAGLFSASSSGTMFARQVFSVVNKGSGNTLIVTWQISFS